MKLTFFYSVIFFFCTLQLNAIDASVSFATFKGPSQNYVEIYLTVIGKTVDYEKLDSLQYQAKVEVTLLFKKGEEIVKFDKYALNSPITERTLDFMDVKRYSLENGTYTLELNLKDMTNESNFQSYSTPLEVHFNEEEILQSDIQLLSTARPDDSNHPFVKNGLYMVALPFNFCDKDVSVLQFYNEIYNTDKKLKEDYLISYSIEKIDGKGAGLPILIGHKRRSPKAVNTLLIQMDIKELVSGNYRLKLEVRNREKELLSMKSTLFQRSNPYLDTEPEQSEGFDITQTFVANLSADELRYSLKGIAPIISTLDIERLNYILEGNDLNRQQRFLFNYWAKKSVNHPETAYNTYMEVVRAVDKKYKSGFGYGFETDRGHIFLKYGKPSDIIAVEDEPIAPPYEIWSYNRIDKINQANVKFLFYNPNYAAGDYRLLHSNARGEISNPQWQLELYKQAPDQLEGNDYLNGTQIKDGLNRQAARYFNDF